MQLPDVSYAKNTHKSDKTSQMAQRNPRTSAIGPGGGRCPVTVPEAEGIHYIFSKTPFSSEYKLLSKRRASATPTCTTDVGHQKTRA